MSYLEAQKKVLEWAETANSYEKLGFFKSLCQTMGLEEIHHGKNIFSKTCKKPENRKRKWIGPSSEESSWRFNSIVSPREPRDAPPPSLLSRSKVPRREEEVVAWWKSFEGNTVGYDVEHVHLKEFACSVLGIRGGKLAVVNQDLKTIYNTAVYYKPGSFMTDYHHVRVSGIREKDLINGIDPEKATKDLFKLFESALVIVCGGGTDFSSVDLDIGKFHTFDLQTFYRRHHTTQPGTYGMSLRDIYFLEFGTDFQGTRSHSAENDARATLKIFLQGYQKRMKNSTCMWDDKYYECFDDSVRLKDYDKRQQFYCNNEKKFKDWKVQKCNCSSCKELF